MSRAISVPRPAVPGPSPIALSRLPADGCSRRPIGTTWWSSTSSPMRGGAEPHEIGGRSQRQRLGQPPSGSAEKLGRLDAEDLELHRVTRLRPRARARYALNGIRRGNHGEFWMVDGGPQSAAGLSFDPKTEQFPRLQSSADDESGSASGNTVRVHPDDTVWPRQYRRQPGHPASTRRPKQFSFFDVPARRQGPQETPPPYGHGGGRRRQTCGWSRMP